MTRAEFRAALARAGIAPVESEVAELYAAWQRMEAGHLSVLRRGGEAGRE
jgi:hypothetical protein